MASINDYIRCPVCGWFHIIDYVLKADGKRTVEEPKTFAFDTKLDPSVVMWQKREMLPASRDINILEERNLFALPPTYQQELIDQCQRVIDALTTGGQAITRTPPPKARGAAPAVTTKKKKKRPAAAAATEKEEAQKEIETMEREYSPEATEKEIRELLEAAKEMIVEEGDPARAAENLRVTGEMIARMADQIGEKLEEKPNAELDRQAGVLTSVANSVDQAAEDADDLMSNTEAIDKALEKLKQLSKKPAAKKRTQGASKETVTTRGPAAAGGAERAGEKIVRKGVFEGKPKATPKKRPGLQLDLQEKLKLMYDLLADVTNDDSKEKIRAVLRDGSMIVGQDMPYWLAWEYAPWLENRIYDPGGTMEEATLLDEITGLRDAPIDRKTDMPWWRTPPDLLQRGAYQDNFNDYKLTVPSELVSLRELRDESLEPAEGEDPVAHSEWLDEVIRKIDDLERLNIRVIGDVTPPFSKEQLLDVFVAEQEPEALEAEVEKAEEKPEEPQLSEKEQVIDKWVRREKKNIAHLENDIEKLMKDKYDLDKVEESIEEYKEINRKDFDTAEEYKDERNNQWDQIMEDINDAEPLEEEEE